MQIANRRGFQEQLQQICEVWRKYDPVRFETKGGDQFQVLTPVLFLSSRHTSRGWSGCANARRGRPSPFCHTELYRSRTMIVCSCNVLSVSDVRACLNPGPDCPRTPAQVYQCLGCSPDCGRCARTLRSIISDALGAAAEANVSEFSLSLESRHVQGANAQAAASAR